MMKLQTLFDRYRNLILPISVIACIGVLLVPLPPFVMDILLAGNIAIALLVLLSTIYIKTPLEFSVFPSLLVATTLGRLVLNVGTTRLILTRAGTEGEMAGGGMIRAFGSFVSGDLLAVGVVIFTIIVLIQFLVITKGATRISEVAARFALDGMPGRQMAIDADLNSGTITSAEAQERRKELMQQADFYAAMDGASKFVRGDAIAGVLITLINILGGLSIGLLYAGMSLSDSLTIFTKLTIGDGLASQIPAFLISVAAALLVTRSNQKTDLPNEFLDQLFSQPQGLAVAGGFLGLLVFTNLPTVPLLILGGGCVGLSVLLGKQRERQSQEVERQTQQERARSAANPEHLLTVDPLKIEIGANLLILADPNRGGDLMDRVTRIRSHLASEMGFLLPKVRLKDNLRLPSNVYLMEIAGNRVAEGEVIRDRIFSVDEGQCSGSISGIEMPSPVTGETGVWITSEQRELAIAYGFRTYSPSELIAAHLDSVARRHASELLTRDQTKQLTEQLRKANPIVVDEVLPDAYSLPQVQRVLHSLLDEDIPIRQLGLIFEALGDFACRNSQSGSFNARLLTQYVRDRLARCISQRFADASGRLQVLTIDPALEDQISVLVDSSDSEIHVRMSPRDIDGICDRINALAGQFTNSQRRPVILVRPALRAAVRELTRVRCRQLIVLSYSEITLETKTVSIGVVTGSLAMV